MNESSPTPPPATPPTSQHHGNHQSHWWILRVIPGTSPLAAISLISGIAGWTFLPLLGSIVGVICGHLAKSEIKKSGGVIGGDGMATAGLILSYSAIVISLCVVCALVLLPALGILSIPFLTGNGSY